MQTRNSALPPWIEDLRKDKPYQLEDRVEQLFHEKSQSWLRRWNRLFDQTIAALRFKVGGKELAIRATLTVAGPRRRKAQSGPIRTRMAHLSLVTNTSPRTRNLRPLARLQDVAIHATQQPRRTEVVDALVASVRAAYPKLSHRYYRLKRTGSKEEAAALDRNAPCVCPHRQHRLAGGAQHVLSPIAASRQEGRHRRALFSDRWIDDGRCGPARRPAHSASDHAVGASHVLMTTRASRAM